MLRFLFPIIRLFLLTSSLVPFKIPIHIFLVHHHGDINQTVRACMQHASIWTYYTHANNCKTSHRPGL